jgi:hypothetical protein
VLVARDFAVASNTHRQGSARRRASATTATPATDDSDMPHDINSPGKTLLGRAQRRRSHFTALSNTRTPLQQISPPMKKSRQMDTTVRSGVRAKRPGHSTSKLRLCCGSAPAHASRMVAASTPDTPVGDSASSSSTTTIEALTSRSIGDLPAHLLYAILDELTKFPAQLARCAAVSREWHDVAASDRLWRGACMLQWPSTRQSPAIVIAAGGPRLFYKQRQMTIALLSTQATADAIAARHVAADARVAADNLWMVDIMRTDGSVLFSQTVQPDVAEWEDTFPVVLETKLVDTEARAVQFDTIASQIDELSVSIHIVRRSDNKMLCIANDEQLHQECLANDSERSSEWIKLNVISADCAVSIDHSDDHFAGAALLGGDWQEQAQPPSVVARIELDGTDPDAKGQVTVSLMLLAEGDDPTLAEFANAMKASPWY